ncbi:Phospholipid scramblase 2 [Lamellibrachia satsuma]|nr:Phospholipid scramblase 2 [Lamellibrachia satsuma]
MLLDVPDCQICVDVVTTRLVDGARGATMSYPGWSPPPAPRTGCPPGLEYLTMVDQLLIHQQVELLEVFSGWETANKYAVKNTLGQQIFFAAEESNFCIKQCCGPQRPFQIHIMDFMNREVMRIDRPFKLECCGNFSPLFPCCRMQLEVQAPVGTTIGYFKQDCSCIAPKFSVSDAQDQVQLNIAGPLCICDSPCIPFDQQFIASTSAADSIFKNPCSLKSTKYVRSCAHVKH